MRTAVGLIARGYPGPAGMTPGQVAFASRCVAEHNEGEIDRIAVGGRYAQASVADWDKRFNRR